MKLIWYLDLQYANLDRQTSCKPLLQRIIPPHQLSTDLSQPFHTTSHNLTETIYFYKVRFHQLLSRYQTQHHRVRALHSHRQPMHLNNSQPCRSNDSLCQPVTFPICCLVTSLNCPCGTVSQTSHFFILSGPQSTGPQSIMLTTNHSIIPTCLQTQSIYRVTDNRFNSNSQFMDPTRSTFGCFTDTLSACFLDNDPLYQKSPRLTVKIFNHSNRQVSQTTAMYVNNQSISAPSLLERCLLCWKILLACWLT